MVIGKQKGVVTIFKQKTAPFPVNTFQKVNMLV